METDGQEKDKGLVLELIRGSRLEEAQQRYSRDPTDENLRSLQEFRRAALERYKGEFLTLCRAEQEFRPAWL